MNFPDFPNLKVVVQQAPYRGERFVIFPQVIHRRLEQRLRNPDMVPSVEGSRLFAAISADIEQRSSEDDVQEFEVTVEDLKHYDIELKAAFWYLVKVKERFEWPFHTYDNSVFTQEFCSVS